MTPPRVATWDELERALTRVDLVAEMEAAFTAFSEGRAVVPPPGELLFDDPPGEVHIKSGYVRGEEFYVVKIASGFYDNPARGLSSSDGMMVLFRQATGEPAAVLLDRGHLTDLRTAAAGAVAAKHLAPSSARCVGVLGAGIQARLQLQLVKDVCAATEARVWARRPEAAAALCDLLVEDGLSATPAASPAEVADSCQLIVTTTPSTTPLLLADQVRPGTHVTAIGSDTPAKQELDAGLLARADVICVDSRDQCRSRGEVHRAHAAGALEFDHVIELGDVIADRAPGRTDEAQITICDLTGLGVQDVRVAAAALAALR